MDTKWLEDFVSLAETRSFSRSAQLRHVTQPAFSRRIQSLEAWAGTDLVDRSSYPTRLTPAGQTLYEQAVEWLQTLQTARALLRQHTAVAKDTLEFAVPHTLAFTFYPAWLSALRGVVGPVKSRLIALNVHDAVMRLTEGSCDLLLTYHHASQPIQLDTERYEMLCLGQEVVMPFVKPNPRGEPLHRLPGRPHEAIPFLAYAPGAYLSRVVDWVLRQSATAVHLERVYETDTSESLKAMAIEGHGVAFLPISAVRQALGDGRLVSAAPSEGHWRGELDIRLYRERPAGRRAKRVAQAFWDDVQRHLGPQAV
jgi:LysR family transcriptional regulator, hypochlorite-specific transcription factor HypT